MPELKTETGSSQGARVWNNPEIRDVIVTKLARCCAWKIMVLNKECFPDVVARRFRNFDHGGLDELRKICQNPQLLSIYLASVRRLKDPRLWGHQDFLDVLEIYPKVREIAQYPGGTYVWLLGGRRARLKEYCEWVLSASESGAESITAGARSDHPDLLNPTWEVDFLYSIKLVWRQEADSTETRNAVARMLASDITRVLPNPLVDKIIELDVNIGVDAEAVLEILSALERSRIGALRSLRVDCHDFTIGQQADILRAGGSGLQDAFFANCASFDLGQLRSAPQDAWTGCPSLKALHLTVRHERLERLPEFFASVNDFEEVTGNLSVNDGSNKVRLFDHRLLPTLERLDIVFHGRTHEALFHPDGPGLNHVDGNFYDWIGEKMWSVVRLTELELQALERLVPPNCEVQFHLYLSPSLNDACVPTDLLEDRLLGQIRLRQARVV